MRTSLRRISSMLWSEALRTVTPPTRTGSSSAIGVSTPVRPTDGTMLRTRVIACRGLNFHASPARRARHLAERALERQVVHLDDEPVDLEGQPVALGFERGKGPLDLREAEI